jgi:hypothetical protein
MFMTYIHIKFTRLTSVVNSIKLKHKYTARYTLHMSSCLLMKSPTKLYCISHTPAIVVVRILKLNSAENDHNWKLSLASSSQCIDTGVHNM